MTMAADSKSDASIWNALRKAQEDYARALKGLDAIILSEHKDFPAPDGRYAIEQAGKVRHAAYAQYRQAMDELLIHLRDTLRKSPPAADKQ
jgi:hypothetical protein